MRKGAVIQGIVDVPDSGGGQDYKDFARLHELFSNQYVKFSSSRLCELGHSVHY